MSAPARDSALSRSASSAFVASDYLPALTGLRGLAASWVLLFHLWQFSGAPALTIPLGPFAANFTPLAHFGYMGVDLFFVLSGFLLSMPWHRAHLNGTQSPNFLDYAKRRCRRVLPAYYVQLAIIVIVLFATGGSAASTLPNVVAHTLLAQNLLPYSIALNGVYWTMPIEWDFYIVMPLVMALLARVKPLVMLIVFTLLAVAFRYACFRALTEPAWAQFAGYPCIIQLPGRADEFFYGVFGAWIYLRYPVGKIAGFWLMIFGITMLGTAMAILSVVGDFIANPSLPWTLMYFSWLGIAFGSIVLGAAVERRAHPWLDARPIAWLGLISYSLYLWHYPTLSVAQHFGWTASGDVVAFLENVLVLLPPILLIAWLSQHFVERPFLAARTSRERGHGLPASLER